MYFVILSKRVVGGGDWILKLPEPLYMCRRIHDNWECNYCCCTKLISWLGFFSPSAAGPLICASAEISTLGARVKCALFVYVSHAVYSPPDEYPLPSIYLLFLICALKVSRWLVVRFLAGGGEGRGRKKKNPICLISQAKIWAAQQNLISCVSYSSALRYSHGNAFLLRESQPDQCGPCLIWPWKKGRWRREV